MACRAALLAVLPSTSSALAAHQASLRGVGLHDDTERLDLARMLMPAESDCQEAQTGSDCFKSVEYLRSQGFKTHPAWYPGYTSESSFVEVQDMLHGLEKAKCPKPCYAQFAQVSPRTNEAASVAKFDCRDTIEGDLCYNSVTWLKEVGFELHPDWYLGLDTNSSTASIQAELHRKGKSDCPLPCAPTVAWWRTNRGAQEKAQAQKEVAAETQETEGVDCIDATFGTQCYTDVSYGMAEGIRNHPQFYDGLKESANFKQVQEYLYLNNRSLCERPCAAKKMSLDMMVNSYEDMREKKMVQDMNADELTRYLDGDWDGYVAKVFRSSEDSSTFEKRKYNPTRAPPLAKAQALNNEAEALAEKEEAEAKAAEPLPIIKGAIIEPKKPASDDAEATSPEKTADDATPTAPLNITAELEETVANTEATLKAEAEAEAQRQEEAARSAKEAAEAAEAEAEAQRQAEAARLAKDAAEAADEEAQHFPETVVIPSTPAARELLVCLSKLRNVTSETFGDIKGECEEKLPFEGDERVALAKESMRYFLWAQRHVQWLKAHPDVKAKEEAAEAEAAKAEEARSVEEKRSQQEYDSWLADAKKAKEEAAEAEAAKAEEARPKEAKADEAKAEEAKADEAKSKEAAAQIEQLTAAIAKAESDAAALAGEIKAQGQDDQDVVGEPMPEMDASSLGETVVAAPEKHKETPEEMEQRLREELMQELNPQTTVAPHKETEEEMRERIKAEVMRELATSKSA